VAVAALLAALALLTGCSGSGPAAEKEKSTKQAAQAVVPMSGDDLQSDHQTVIRNVLPSVVQIQSGSELGSGIVYDDRGHIVTNAHVVGSEKSFRVTTAGSEDTRWASSEEGAARCRPPAGVASPSGPSLAYASATCRLIGP
jgi:putative serine protease PepD